MIDLQDLGDQGVTFTRSDGGDLGIHVGGLSAIGDVTGDGLADLLLGVGQLFLVFGTQGTFTTDLNNLGSAGSTLSGLSTARYTGLSISGAGDFNGDGIADFAIGAPRAGSSYEGAVYVVAGSQDPGATLNVGNASNSLATVVGSESGNQAGYTVIGPGDLNGDGFDDVAFHTYLRNQSDILVGGINIVFGGDGTTQLGRIFGVDGDRLNTKFGGGDVNGDGVADLILTTTNDRAHLVLGGVTNLVDDLGITQLGTAEVTISGPSGFGRQATVLGDINGDGFNDLAIQGETVDGTTRIYVVYGRASFTDFNVASMALGTDGFRVDVDMQTPPFPGAMADSTAGDFNGDGIDDFFIATATGEAYLVFGTTTARSTLATSAIDADASLGIKIVSDDLIAYGGPVGDVNGDGLADFVVHTAATIAFQGGDSHLIFGQFMAQSTTGDDSLTGGALAETIDGGDGNDTLNGGGGDDSVAGASGNDLLIGGAGNDTLNAATGMDSLYGQDGDDSLIGDIDDDRLFGNHGNDTLEGGTGDDLIKGHPGDDLVRADAGDDTAFGGADDDEIAGGTGADALNGNSGGDIVEGDDGNDTLRGQGGRDLLRGGDGGDMLLGMQGYDTLEGGAGDDTLIGGPANDTMTGGDGADIFAFAPGQGTDVITDFADGTDLLDFGVASLDLLDIAAGASGAVIGYVTDANPLPTSVTLSGISANQLSAADFLLA